MDSADAVLAYDKSFLKIALNRDRTKFLLRYANGLEKELPFGEVGARILRTILEATADEARPTVGTRAAPTEFILHKWEIEERRKVYNEQGHEVVDLENLEIEI